MDEKLQSQILRISASGKCNMLDTTKVQWIAFQRRYYNLVQWITNHREEYIEFIIKGLKKDDQGG